MINYTLKKKWILFNKRYKWWQKISSDKDSIFGKIIFKAFDGEINETFSLGHRNQGLIEYKNNIIATEHGPKGGDEINLISIKTIMMAWKFFWKRICWWKIIIEN